MKDLNDCSQAKQRELHIQDDKLQRMLRQQRGMARYGKYSAGDKLQHQPFARKISVELSIYFAFTHRRY